MKPAPTSLMLQLLAQSGANAAMKTLTDCGYAADKWTLRKIRQQLLDNGKAHLIAGGGAAFCAEDPARTAEHSSRELLRLHLTTGKHWITDASRFAAACEQAGLAA